MSFSGREAVLWTALVTAVAYRSGWSIGARRMSAAMTGRRIGMRTWPSRIRASRRRPVVLPPLVEDGPEQEGGPERHAGPYL